MSVSFESTYYENPALWDPARYTNAEAERTAVTLEWLPSALHSVLDVGCGNGVLTNQIQLVPTVVGIDRSLAALRRVQQPTCRADVMQLPFEDNAFDAVVSTEVLEHLPVTIFRQALAEIVRVARRYILISVPYCEDLTQGYVSCPYCGCRFHRYYHMRSFSKHDIQHLFAHWPAVHLVRASGIMPYDISGTVRLKQKGRTILRRFWIPTAPFTSMLLCPQCGYTLSATSTKAAGSKRRRYRSLGLSRMVDAVVPAKQTYRWWLALYCKDHSQ